MTKDSPGVITHINMMQGIINRMADNSKSCKQWCILLVSAILTIAIKDSTVSGNTILLCFIPIVMLCFLDSYYLYLERQARYSMNVFVDKLSQHRDVENMVFRVIMGRYDKSQNVNSCPIVNWFSKLFCFCKNIFCAIMSLSVWPYYVSLALLIFILDKYCLNLK